MNATQDPGGPSPVDTFDSQWREIGSVPDWDDLSEEIYRALAKAGVRCGSRTLEVGCGTGRISARLAGDGCNVTMLDASPAALKIARDQLERRQAAGKVVLGDMMSLPFADGSFDVAWSSGVLEHFEDADLIASLTEMRRVTVPQGLVVTLVPHSLALGYRLAIWNGRRKGTWVEGLERSFLTLRKQVETSGLLTVREWSIAPRETELFFFAHVNLRGIRRIARCVLRLLRWLGLGDYLLVNVARRPE